MHQATFHYQSNNHIPGAEKAYRGYVHPVPPIIAKSAPEEKNLEKSAQVEKQRRKSARERLERDIYLAEYRFYKDKLYKNLVKNLTLTPLEAAHRYWYYVTEYSKGGYEYRTEPFKDSTSGKEDKVSTALETGRLGRLLVSLTDPVMYNLKYHHLGLPRALANSECIFSHEIIEVWRERLKILLPKKTKYHYRFEVGWKGQLHVHLIINRITEGPLSNITSEKVATEIYEEKGAAKYLYKPIMPWTLDNLALRIEHERIRGEGKRFPRTRGTIGLGNRKGIEL